MGCAMMYTLQSLCQELNSIQQALVEDAFEDLSWMVERYHLHLHDWLESSIERDLDAVRRLHNLHWQTLAQLQSRHKCLRARMQADHQGGRVARAYLSSSPA